MSSIAVASDCVPMPWARSNPVRAGLPSQGHAWWQVDLVDGCSASTTASASYPVSLLVPRARDQASWAYLASHGGGLVSGDEITITTRIGPGASAYLGTQAVGKVYRTLPDGLCMQQIVHHVATDALLVYAPDPISCFTQARYHQTLDINLAAGASVMICDGFLAGREARGEFWDFNEITSRTTIRVAGQMVAVDPLRLLGRSTARRMAGWGVFASILLAGPRCAPAITAGLAALPPIRSGAALLASAMPCAGGQLLRLAARSHADLGAILNLILEPLAEPLGGQPWLRRP